MWQTPTSAYLPTGHLTPEQYARAEALDLARDACSSYKEAERDGGSGFAYNLHADTHHLMLVAAWILGEPDEGEDVSEVPSDPGAGAETPLFGWPGKHARSETLVTNGPLENAA
jgi:hypothetical protein